MIYNKKDFISFWGDGYIESFDGYNGFKPEQVYNKAIKPFEKKKVCLEIGCGGGFWTNKYLKNFKVTGIDVIPKSKNITCKYFELNDKDYFCTPIKSNSIDFVWCFGVFCHLPQSAVSVYVKNILRVLKKNGVAVLMFPNWDKCPKGVKNRENYKESAYGGLGWFYIDYGEILKDINYKILFPEFRDTLICIKNG